METQLRELVRRLERKMGMLNEGEMSCCGITLAQCHALVEIGRSCCVAESSPSAGIALNTLSGRLGLDNSTTSRTVQHLVLAGLARREPDPGDRRAVVIALTEQGRSLFRQVEDGMNRQFQGILARIPAGSRAQVVESLALLENAMQACCQEKEKSAPDTA